MESVAASTQKTPISGFRSRPFTQSVWAVRGFHQLLRVSTSAIPALFCFQLSGNDGVFGPKWGDMHPLHYRQYLVSAEIPSQDSLHSVLHGVQRRWTEFGVFVPFEKFRAFSRPA